MRRAGVGLVVFIFLASGCSGREPSSSVSPSPPSTGTVEGRVLDEAGLPVANATVRILLSNFTGLTDPDGSFEFRGVPAGTVRVVAAALDHTSSTQGGLLEAGGSLRLEFHLRSLPPIVPYHRTLRHDGVLSCRLPNDVSCGENSPTENATYWWPVETGLAGIVLELQWTPSSAGTGEQLRLEVRAAAKSSCGLKYQEREGRSILKLEVREGFPTRGGYQCAYVRAAQSGAAAEQPYALFVTNFYHEAPPADFSAIAKS